MAFEIKTPFELDTLEYEIVEHIRQNGQVTRNDLANLFGMSRSKITNVIHDLIRAGILKDALPGESSGGRRPGLIDLDSAFCYVLGIHMGATGASIVLANFSGEIIESHRISIYVRDEPSDVMDNVFEHVIAMIERRRIDPSTVFAVCVGVPAPVDKATNRIVSPATMLGWDDYSIVDYCLRYFPNAQIRLDNDAGLMALGELRVGLGRDHQNFILVKIGTGVGCGIICNGQIYRGTRGVSGHIGHVSIDRNGPVCHCGNIGCLEKYVSGPAIAERAMQYARSNPDSILAELMKERGGYLLSEDVGTAAGRGERFANEIIMESGRIIGEVLATLVSFFNPSLVILSGGVCDIGPQFLISIHRTILEYSLPLSTQQFQIKKSELGHQAGMRGTVELALDYIFTTHRTSIA